MSVPPSTPLALDGQQAVAIVQQAAGYLPMYFAFTASIASTRTFSSIMTAIVVFVSETLVQIRLLPLQAKPSKLTLLYQDHFATFPSEWRYLWRAKPGWISLCLLINRYGIIASLGYILYLVRSVPFFGVLGCCLAYAFPLTIMAVVLPNSRRLVLPPHDRCE